MSKKENEHEVSSLLSRLRESLTRPKKNSTEEIISDTDGDHKDSFDEDLSALLGKHLQSDVKTEETGEEMLEAESESPFEVDELEIVTDGTLNPVETELPENIELDEPVGDRITAEEAAIFSDLDALMARMTPEQRKQFEAEMNNTEEVPESPCSESVKTEETPKNPRPEPVKTENEPESPHVEAIVTEAEPTGGKTMPQNVIALPGEIDHAVLDETEDDIVAVDEEVSDEVVEDYVAVEELPPAVSEDIPVSATDEIIDVADVPVGLPADGTEEEGEIYNAAEEDEEYDLPEVEAFRALESRMTPEQRAQFEQALLEAQEAERAEKEAKRLAKRQEAEKVATEEVALPEAVETTVKPVAEPIAEDVITEPDAIPTIEIDNEADVTDEDAPQIICVTPVSEDESLAEEPIFLVADENEDTEDMPTIKVGVEPSSFTLYEMPEPDPEPEPEMDEEAALAALLSRMTPEQLARFREEMLSQDAEDTEVDAENLSRIPVQEELVETGERCDTEKPEPVVNECLATETVEETVPTEEIEEPVPVTEVEKNVPVTEVEETVLTEEIEDPVEDTEIDPINAILNDPDKLDELMSRLTPEQAAEVERLLRGDNEEVEETVPVEPVVVPEGTYETVREPVHHTDEVFEEDREETIYTPKIEEDEEPTVLWSEPVDPKEKIPLDDILDEHNAGIDAKREDRTEDEDLYSMEISDDMTDEEILLMLGLGYEKELIYQLGRERVERAKKRAVNADAHDSEFADAYAYDGQEYRRNEQTDRIRYRYGAEKRSLWARLIGTSFFALLLFLYECCGVFRGAFGGLLDPAHYPVIAVMVGWQLLIFASAFSWKQLFRGIRSAFVLEPDNHAMTAVVVAVVMFSNILMAMVFKGSTLYLYNFPAALCLVCTVLCDLADVCREELTFEVISLEDKKYVAEPITLNAAYTDMPIDPIDADIANPMSNKNAMYVRRVGFVKNYFRRTNRKTRHSQILNFVFLPLLAFAVVLGIVTGLIGNGTVPALNTFVVTVLLCMPLSYTVVHTLPLYYEARRLHKQGCAIVGESSVEEYNQYATVIFEDKDLFPPTLIKTKGLKLYENNLIYSVILKISLLFREIGGPINDVLDLDKEELKRFIASGQAGSFAEGKVSLERMTEDGVIATLSDGSYVVAGSADFLRSRGINVQPSVKDQQLLQSGDMSILYLAFDGELGARFYVDYQPDPEFEALAGMLGEDEFRVAVRTLDPGIHEDMIAHKCQNETAMIYTVRATVRELTEKPSSEAKVDSGLVCSDDPRKMLLPLRAIRNLRRLNLFVLRLYAGSMLLNMLVAIALTAFSVVGYMSSLFVSLYMLVWLATSLVLTKLFLNK